MSDATLLVLAKAPVPGRVKTRLSPPCSPEQAAVIAEAAIVDTLTAAIATPRVRAVLVLDGEPGPWIPAGVEIRPQVPGDLGTRLRDAFAGSTVAGSTVAGPTILVGMDTPQVTSRTLRSAVDALLAPHTDAVLGLTIDGGWWIIGFRNPHPLAFVDVPMSTATTGAHQIERLRHLGLRVRTLAVEMDVDTFADARTVAARIPASTFGRAVFAVGRELADTRPSATAS